MIFYVLCKSMSPLQPRQNAKLHVQILSDLDTEGGACLGRTSPFSLFYLFVSKVPKKEKVTNFVGVPLSCDPMFSSSQILYILFILACLLAETSQAKFHPALNKKYLAENLVLFLSFCWLSHSK